MYTGFQGKRKLFKINSLRQFIFDNANRHTFAVFKAKQIEKTRGFVRFEVGFKLTQNICIKEKKYVSESLFKCDQD